MLLISAENYPLTTSKAVETVKLFINFIQYCWYEIVLIAIKPIKKLFYNFYDYVNGIISCCNILLSCVKKKIKIRKNDTFPNDIKVTTGLIIGQVWKQNGI